MVAGAGCGRWFRRASGKAPSQLWGHLSSDLHEVVKGGSLRSGTSVPNWGTGSGSDLSRRSLDRVERVAAADAYVGSDVPPTCAHTSCLEIYTVYTRTSKALNTVWNTVQLVGCCLASLSYAQSFLFFLFFFFVFAKLGLVMAFVIMGCHL